MWKKIGFAALGAGAVFALFGLNLALAVTVWQGLGEPRLAAGQEPMNTVVNGVWIQDEGSFVPCLEVSKGTSEASQYTCNWGEATNQPTNDDPIRSEGYSIGSVVLEQGTVRCLIANVHTADHEYYDCDWLTLTK